MPEAIVYCDQCKKMIAVADVKSGEAIVTPAGAFCAACVGALEPEQKEALKKLAAGEPAGTSLSSVFPRPKPLAPRRPPTGKTTLPPAARRKRSYSTTLRPARAEPQPKKRAGAMAMVGVAVGLIAGVLALTLRSPDSSRKDRPRRGAASRPTTGAASRDPRTPPAGRVSPITGRPLLSHGGNPSATTVPGGTPSYRPPDSRGAGSVTVFERGDTWRYFKGTSFPGAGWNTRLFDDSSWLSGPTGIGYEDGDDATVLSDMQNGYLTVYMRREFIVGRAAAARSLSFSVCYDDGFVAFINGSEVARRGVPAGQDQNTATTTGHDAGTPEVIDLTADKSSLVDGTNVFAIELHNADLGSSDASMIPELSIEGGDPGRAPAGAEPAPAEPDIARGLVAHWTFDEKDGDTATDASGNGFAGSLLNMDPAGARVTGRPGGALSFDGVDDHVHCGNDRRFSEFNRFTLAAWVKPDDTTTDTSYGDPIIAKAGNRIGYQLTWRHDGRFGFMLADAQMTWSSKDKTNGTWYHVAAVFEKGTAYIYVDGVEEQKTSPGYRWNTAAPLCIGAYQGKDRYLKATIDDVRLYDRALTAEEIRALVAAGPLAPTVVSTVRSNAYVGHRYSYTIRALGQPPPTFKMSGLPEWLKFDGKDTVSGTPGKGDIGVTGIISVTAENAQGSHTQTFTIKVEELTLASGLVGHWKFDEGEGVLARDATGNTDPGAIHGARWAKGRSGGALAFDGTDDYVITPDLKRRFTDNTVTMCLWFKATAGGMIVAELGQSSINTGYHNSQIEILSTGEVKVRVWSLDAVSLGTATMNEWHLVALRYDDSTDTLDGFLDAVEAATDSTGAKSTGSGQFYAFGAQDITNLGDGTWFDGLIDEVRIYDRALAAEEVAELYRSTGGEIREIAATRDFPGEAGAVAAPAEETPPARQGLLGEYYGNMTLAGDPALTRIDPRIDFDWETRSPGPKLPKDRFSCRWRGTIRPEYSETYTFHVYRDDGVRVWIGGELIIDRWRRGSGELSAKKTLEAGVSYRIRIEYYDRTGPARVSLGWQSDSQAREIVSESALSPAAVRSP